MLKSNKSSRKLLLIRILALFSIFISCSISECIRLLTPGSRNDYTDVMKDISISNLFGDGEGGIFVTTIKRLSMQDSGNYSNRGCAFTKWPTNKKTKNQNKQEERETLGTVKLTFPYLVRHCFHMDCERRM